MIVQHTSITVERQKLEVLQQIVKHAEEAASQSLGMIVKFEVILAERDSASSVTHDTLALIIKNITSSVFKAESKDIESHSRKRELTEARYVCFTILKWSSEKYSSKMSLKKIGSYFERRDHSTILKGMQVYQDLYDTEPSFKRDADKCLSVFLEYMQAKQAFQVNGSNQLNLSI